MHKSLKENSKSFHMALLGNRRVLYIIMICTFMRDCRNVETEGCGTQEGGDPQTTGTPPE